MERVKVIDSKLKLLFLSKNGLEKNGKFDVYKEIWFKR